MFFFKKIKSGSNKSLKPLINKILTTSVNPSTCKKGVRYNLWNFADSQGFLHFLHDWWLDFYFTSVCEILFRASRKSNFNFHIQSTLVHKSINAERHELCTWLKHSVSIILQGFYYLHNTEEKIWCSDVREWVFKCIFFSVQLWKTETPPALRNWIYSIRDCFFYTVLRSLLNLNETLKFFGCIEAWESMD